MVAHPNAAFMDNHKRVIEQPCHPTDGLAYTLHATGMGSRIGDQSHPSILLLNLHVRNLDRTMDQRYLATTTLLERSDARAVKPLLVVGLVAVV
jgi:hypothetical protein